MTPWTPRQESLDCGMQPVGKQANPDGAFLLEKTLHLFPMEAARGGKGTLGGG
jgi:hypothetical protein